MIIDGARIYNEGVGIGHDCEEKIRQIVTAFKTVYPTSEVSMRFLKSGRSYEALLWGKADSVPIGVYNRGASMIQLLETVYKNVKKQCVRAWRLKGSPRDRQEAFALAG